MKFIQSIQNPYIKELTKLKEKSRERKKSGLFLIEGKREILLAVKGNYTVKTILFLQDLINKEDIKDFTPSNTNFISVSKEVYKKLAYRDTTEGIIAVVKSKHFAISEITFKSKNPLVLVMENIEKPGNIGAMLRTADAAKVDAVFIANLKTDLYNPNIIRSSIGCLFTNKIAVGASEEIISFLQKNKFNIYSATLQNSNEYYKESYVKASAIVVGSEANGLSKTFINKATKSINIPMQGSIDSMNVSVAAAILLFEAKRQRGFLT